MIDPAIADIVIAAAVAVIGGDRAWQMIKFKRNGKSLATKADINEMSNDLTEKISSLDRRMERHLGFHEGKWG